MRLRRPGLEAMEGRILLAADLAMTGATALSPSVVVAQYTVGDQPLSGAVPVTVYRSATRSVDASSVEIGQTTLTGAALGVGTHTASVTLASPLTIDPTLKYVVVMASPQDANPADDMTSFRRWVVGVVTHGVEQPPGYFPAWVTQLATAMQAQGYDDVLPYNWSDLSSLPSSQAPTLAAQRLDASLMQTIQTLPGFAPGDTVDIHLVGHSRGGGMITQAAALLPTSSPPLQGGYLKLTLLDPHPTVNTIPPNYSSSSGPIGTYTATLFVRFQSLANDPPLTIPVNVDGAEVFFQHANVTQAIAPDEKFVNSWGEVPAGGNLNNIAYYNVTTLSPSHAGVHQLYLQMVVPTLGTGAAVPLPPVPRPQPSPGGGPAFANARAGIRYEQQLIRQSGVPPAVGNHVLRGFNTLNRYIAQDRSGAIAAQIGKLGRFLSRQSGRTIPTASADALLLGLQQGRVLLLGQIPATAHRVARASSPSLRV